jgi:hypothetical protein
MDSRGGSSTRRSAYNIPMKVTRRKMAGLLTISAALPGMVRAQALPANRAVGPDAARGEFREAARALDAVKLPRSTEPATRFEA